MRGEGIAGKVGPKKKFTDQFAENPDGTGLDGRVSMVQPRPDGAETWTRL